MGLKCHLCKKEGTKHTVVLGGMNICWGLSWKSLSSSKEHCFISLAFTLTKNVVTCSAIVDRNKK